MRMSDLGKLHKIYEAVKDDYPNHELLDIDMPEHDYDFMRDIGNITDKNIIQDIRSYVDHKEFNGFLLGLEEGIKMVFRNSRPAEIFRALNNLDGIERSIFREATRDLIWKEM